MKKPHHIKKGKYWRYITVEAKPMVGLFEWPSNKLLARYGMNTGPAKRRQRINAEITSTTYDWPEQYKKKKKRPKYKQVGKSTAYPERDEALRKLGFKDYASYLRCKIWSSIKQCLLDDRMCVACGEPANVLHHTDYSYDTMRGNNPSSLVPLCRACHYKAEFDGDIKVFDLSEVNARLKSMIQNFRLDN